MDLSRITAWIRQNKLAAVAVVGGAFLFMAKKGNGDDGGGDSFSEGGELDDGGGSSVITVPVGIEPSDYDNEDVYDVSGDAYAEGIERGLDLAETAAEKDELAGGDQPATPTTPPAPDKTGITVQGRFFRGATSYTISNVDGQGWTEYVIRFPGHTERWQVKNGVWKSGWDNPTVTVPATTQPKDATPQEGGHNCPSGYTYNTEKKACVYIGAREGGHGCKPGYTFDKSRGKCVPLVVKPGEPLGAYVPK